VKPPPRYLQAEDDVAEKGEQLEKKVQFDNEVEN